MAKQEQEFQRVLTLRNITDYSAVLHTDDVQLNWNFDGMKDPSQIELEQGVSAKTTPIFWVLGDYVHSLNIMAHLQVESI